MYVAVVENKTPYPYSVRGYRGSEMHLQHVDLVIPPNGKGVVGGMGECYPSVGIKHWGWIYLGSANSKAATCQIYMRATQGDGVYDYCVQKYDEGKNTSGEGLPNVGLKYIGPGAYDGVLFTLEPDFNPAC